MRQQRLDFRSEGKCAAIPVVVERLLAKAVAGAEQAAVISVPDGEGEHSTKEFYAIGPMLLISVHYGFGIATGDVAVAAALQGGPQVGMVEDLAVVNNPDAAGLVGHGL